MGRGGNIEVQGSTIVDVCSRDVNWQKRSGRGDSPQLPPNYPMSAEWWISASLSRGNRLLRNCPNHSAAGLLGTPRTVFAPLERRQRQG